MKKLILSIAALFIVFFSDAKRGNTPVVSSFTPISAGYGHTVTITGQYFTGATAVTFGGVAATSFTVVNDNTITATVGTGATGSIAVTNTVGAGTSASGFTYITPPGMALSLNGVNQYVGINASLITVSNSFTVEAWVNPADASNAINIFSTRTGNGYGFDMKLQSGNLIHADIGNGSAWLTTAADASFSYTVGTWYHIAYTVTASGYSIYANGNLVGSGTLSGSPLLLDPAHIPTIGSVSGSSEFFKGSIDEVRVYNTTLTQANILADMQSAALAAPSNIIAYYNFDDYLPGSAVQDVAGTTTGTLYNSPNQVESYAMVVPEPTTSSLLNTSFTATWPTPVTGTVNNYVFDAGTDPTFTTSLVSGSPFTIPVGTNTKTITGLTASTTYYYRVRANKTSVAGQGSGILTTITTTAAANSILFVDGSVAASGAGTSWGTAYKTLDEAITQAKLNSTVSTINVAKGTYTPATANADSAFVIYRGGLKLLGGFPNGGGVRNAAANVVTLDGLTTKHHILVIAGIAANADSVVVDGFTFKNGAGLNATGLISNISYNGQQVAPTGGCGIAMYSALNGEKTTIRNCIFTNNVSAVGNGGAIYTTVSYPLFYNCSFSSNSATFGGAIFNQSTTAGSFVYITNCYFTQNTASYYGGAIYNEQNQANISNCAFYLNTVTGASFNGNIVGGDGGAVASDANSATTGSIFNNDVFYRNSANQWGGAIYSTSAKVTVTNCTLAGNTAVSTGDGFYSDTKTTSVLQDVIMDDPGNNGNEFFNSPGVVTFANCIVNPDPSGYDVAYFASTAGITLTGPSFADSTHALGTDGILGTSDDGLQLSLSSKALNTGSNTFVSSLPTDVTGATRIIAGTVDMGAYENQTPSSYITSFTPTSAGQGSLVTITGVGLGNATAVSFGGTASKTPLNSVSSTSVSAYVQSGSSGSVNITGTGLNVSRAGFTYAAPPGNALNFDGTNDYGTVQMPSTFQSATDFTIEFWMKTTQAGNGGTANWYNGIGVVDADISGAKKDFGISVLDGKLAFGTGDGTNDYTIVSLSNVNTGKWVHVTAIRVVATGVMKLYINSVLEVSGPGSKVGLNDPTSITIGANNGLGRFYNGSIDELRFFVKDRSNVVASDMANILDAGVSGLETYYRFDQGTAGGNNTGINYVTDLTQQGNSATLTNMALTGATSNFVESYAMVTPVAAQASAITGSGFTANWGAVPFGTANNYVLDVSTANNFSSFVSGYNAKSVTALSASVAGLQQNTKYYYRVRADKTSVTGQGTYDTVMSATTTTVPTITSFTPKTAVPGTTVTITGTNFTGATFVSLGGVPASSFSVTNAATVTAVVATGAGVGSNGNNVIVTTPGGTATLGGFFSSTAPGNTLAFDGVDDYVQIPRPVTGGDFTIEYWMRTSQTGNTGTIWWQGNGIVDGDVASVGQADFGTSLLGTKIGFGVGWAAQGSDIGVVSVSDVNTGHWVHVAAVRTQSTGQIVLYINGKQEAAATGGTTLLNGAANLTIGANNDLSHHFNGSVDELRFFNSARTASQVAADMVTSLPPSTTGLASYYNFDEGAAAGSNAAISTLYDAGVGSNNGALVNFGTISGTTTSNWLESYAITVPTTADPTNIGLTSFTANWAAPQTGTFTNYLLQVSTVRDFSSFVGNYHDTVISSSVLSVPLTNLTSGVKYYYRLSANVGTDAAISGQGAYTVIDSATTLTNPPSITSFTPILGVSGTTVTITGVNLTNASAVSFGGVAAASFTVVSNTSITAILAAGGASGRVSVTTPGGTVSKGGFYFGKVPGNALAFDGVDDNVAISPLVLNNFTTATYEAWVYLNNNTNGTILAKQADNVATNSVLSVGYFANAAGSPNTGTPGRVYYRSQNSSPLAASKTILQTGHWYHVAVVYNSTQASIYINGLLDSTVAGNFTLPTLTTAITTIGEWGGSGGGRYLNGRLDELKIFNTNRTAANILSDMQSTIPGSTAGLVAYYNFDGVATGTLSTEDTLFDFSPNAYHGVLNNFAYAGTTSNWVESYAMVIPTGLTGALSATTSFNANWSSPATGAFTGYVADVSPTADFSSSVVTYAPSATTQAVSGLLQNTKYYFRVRADSTGGLVAGQGAYTPTDSITTGVNSPNLTDFNPKTAAAGDTITITGSNLTYTTKVLFGDVSATYIEHVNDNTLRVVPIGANGTTGLTMTIYNQNLGVVRGGFTFLLPTATITGSANVCANSPAPVITFTAAQGLKPFTFSYTLNGVAKQISTTLTSNTVTLTAPTGAGSVYALTNISDSNNNTQAQSGNATITIGQTITSTTRDTVCSSALSSFTWNGRSYTGSTTDTYTTTSAAGCDSVATLILTVTQPTYFTEQDTVCLSQLPFMWHGNSYNAAGTYANAYTTTNAAGCDSVVTLALTVNQPTYGTEKDTTCLSQLPFIWNGNSYNTAGTFTNAFTTTNAAGCDSLVTLVLTVTQPTYGTEYDTVCVSSLPYYWNGNFYNDAGTYPNAFTTTSVAGCDSLVTLVLTVNQPTYGTEYDTICASALPYVWNGNTYYYGGVFSNDFTTTNSAGCDSLVTLALTVNQPTQGYEYDTILPAQLPYNWHGNTYTTGGTYVDAYTTTNATGCDSTVTLFLTINLTTTSDTTAYVCSSQIPFNWRGINYFSTGNYTFDTLNVEGNDSVITLHLTVKAISNTQVTISKSNLPYVWNGNSYNAPGVYAVNISHATGCDSTAVLRLAVTGELPPAAFSYNTPDVFVKATAINPLYPTQLPAGTTTPFGPAFNEPEGIATDAAGNVYVADISGGTITKIAPDGSSSVLASGFSAPFGVASTAAGTLYVTDVFTATVSKIIPDGTVTPLASGFASPYGVAVDASGANIYIADPGDSAIDKILPDGTVQRFWTNSNGPESVTLDGQGNVYSGDELGNITKLSANGSSVIPIGAITGQPISLAVANDGSIYVADSYNSYIDKLAVDGSVTTVGTGLLAPNGVTLDMSGNIYVSDTYNYAVKKIIPQGSPVASYSISPALTAGLQIDAATGIISGKPVNAAPLTTYTVTGNNANGSLTAPVAVTVINTAGQAFGYNTPNVLVNNAAITPLAPVFSPQPLQAGAIATIGSGFNTPFGTVADAAGNIYVTDSYNGQVKKVSADGTTITVLSNAFYDPTGIALDAAGNIYVADYYYSTVSKMSPDGTTITPLGTGFSGPLGLAVDAAGYIYVADNGNGAVKKMSSDGRSISPIGSGFNSPVGVAVDAAGDVFVADEDRNKVKEVAIDGTISTLASRFRFNGPTGVAVDAAGNVYVADNGNNAVEMIASGSTTASTIASGFNSPTSVFVDNAGNIFVADTYNNAIKEIGGTGNLVTNYAISPTLPTGLGIDQTTGIISGTPSILTLKITYTVTATRTAGNLTANLDIIVSGCIPGTWTGTVDNLWTNAANWCGGSVPAATDNAFIPAGTPYSPLINTTVGINDINVSTGAVLTVQQNGADTLYITGDINNSGTLNASAGSIVLRGAGAESITGTVNVNNLTVNSVGVTINAGSRVNVTGVYNAENGILTTNGGLWLRSTAAGTASVAPITGGGFDGNVTVERYIPAHRAWRLLTTPLSNTGTVYQNWQNNGVVDDSTGDNIWKPTGTGSAGDGFTKGGGEASIESYDPVANNWAPLSNTTSTPLSGTGASAANTGYSLFITGPYGSNNILPATGATATTLRATGSLQTGTQQFNYSGLAAGAYILVGNPYASPVDFTQIGIRGTAPANNLTGTMWAWDAKRGNTSYGGYVTFSLDKSNGVYDQDFTSDSTQQTIAIQSGESFFVQAMNSGSATVTINETDKAAASTITGGVFGIQPQTTPAQQLRISLNNSSGQVDGVLAKFGDVYKAGVTDDAAKLYNYDENLSLRIDTNYLAIERRPMPAAGDTMHLDAYALKKSTAYSFTVNPQNMPSGLQAWLVDAYTNTKTPLSMAGSTRVSFNTGTDAGSLSETRFTIVFQTNGVLATATTLKAVEAGSAVQVEWVTPNELGVKQYQVQRSADAQSFTTINTATARNSGNKEVYDFTDAQPITGDNYYRIEIFNSDGTMTYSNVVLVKMQKGEAAFNVYPNPMARNGQLHVQFTNMAAGRYALVLFSTSGKQLMDETIQLDGTTTLQTISLPQGIAGGSYRLVLLDGKGGEWKQQVVVQ